MELYIRQRIFSWTDSYDVYGPDGGPRYEVRAEFFSLTHKIHVYDKQTGREVGAIAQRLLTLLPTFEIEIDGQLMGIIRKSFTLFLPRYQVDYRGWKADGNFVGWDYRVTQGSQEIMTIFKEPLRWSDTYVLRYHDPADEIPGLLLVLAIDAANCSHND